MVEKNMTKKNLILGAFLLVLIFMTVIVNKAYKNIDEIEADKNAGRMVSTETSDILELIKYDEMWGRDDSFLEDSECWVHWIGNEEISWMARDAVFCIPDVLYED